MSETQQLTPQVTPEGKMYWTDGQGQAFDTPEEANQEEDQEMGLSVIDPSQPTNLVPAITNLPLHFRAMELEKYTPEEQAEKVYQSTEYLGVEPIKMSRFTNREVTVTGAAMIWHPPYKGKTDSPDAPLRPGYYKAYFKLEDGTIASTSAWRATQMLAALLPANGWFDWRVPVTFAVTVGDDNTLYLKRVRRLT